MMVFCKANSFYFNVREDRPVEMTLEEFVKCIRSTRWKERVEEYVRLAADGKKQEAKKIKENMPGMIIAGRAEGTHSLKHMKEVSGDAMFDVDHSDDSTPEFVKRLRALPWVRACWRSISQEGLKLVVRIEAETVEEYAVAYYFVATAVGEVLQFPCDMQCKNFSRPCYASYDVDAYFNPEAAVFDWRTPAAENPETVREILEKSGFRKQRFETSMSASEKSLLASESGRPVPAAAPLGEGYVVSFLNDFIVGNPFIAGERNAFLLKLGRVARYRGFSPTELKELSALAVMRLSGPDCPAADIPPRLEYGYMHADVARMAEKSGPNWVRKVQGPSVGYSGPARMEEDAEDEEAESERLRKNVSFFPDEIFETLPEFLKRGLRAARTKRERDILLMSMLVNLSACLPGVQMLYADIRYSPHFYFTSIIAAGRGKGVMELAGLLPDAIQAYLLGLDKAESLRYKDKMLEWDLEVHVAAKAKRKPDLKKLPEKPVRHVLKVSPNISKNQLIIRLEESGERGLMMNATELDMVSGAIGQEYGKHDDVMRAAFHHEEVSSDFKVDDRQITATHPHFAFCASGTPAQLPKFIPSLENGMYSRMGFYVGHKGWQWRSAAPRDGNLDARKLFRELSKELLEKYLFLLKYPTEVVFSADQWAEHTEKFSNYLQDVVGEREDSPGAVVFRHGLIEARIAMVLTALRKCEAGWNSNEYHCTDEDFHTAMELVRVLLEHSLLLSTSMPEKTKEVKPMRSFFRLRPVLRRMPNEFIYTELFEKAKESGISATSLKRYLARVVELGLLVKEDTKYKKTSKTWPRKP